MHLLRRTLPHRSQSRFDGFVSPTVVHHFSLTPSAYNEQPVISPAPIHPFFHPNRRRWIRHWNIEKGKKEKKSWYQYIFHLLTV